MREDEDRRVRHPGRGDLPPVPDNLDALLTRAKAIRKDILRMTTEAGSGHPSSSLSADRGRDGALLRRVPPARRQEPALARPRPVHPLEGARRAGALRGAGRGGLLPARRDHDLAEARQPARGPPEHEAAGRRRGLDRLARPGALARRRPRPGGPGRQEGLPHLRHDRRRRARRGAGLGGGRLGRQVPARQPDR